MVSRVKPKSSFSGGGISSLKGGCQRGMTFSPPNNPDRGNGFTINTATVDLYVCASIRKKEREGEKRN